MEVHGRIAGSSNATLLVTCRLDGEELLAVYKPPRASGRCGTSPAGSTAARWRPTCSPRRLGWGLSPRRCDRAEGPFGEGRCSASSTRTATSHYFTLRDEPAWHPTLMRLCAFDVWPTTPTARAGTSCWPRTGSWAIDNGLCFNEHDKLRTVIWDFGGEPLDAERTWPPCSDWPTTGRRRPVRPAEPDELAATLDRVSWLVNLRAPCPSWSTTGTGRPTLGRWSESPTRLAG